MKAVGLLVLTLAGCGSGATSPGGAGRPTPLADPALEAGAQTTIIPLPIDRIWGFARTVYAQFPIPVNVFSTANYQIGNRGYRPRRIGGQRPLSYLDCGSIPGVIAGDYDVRMTVLTTLREAGTSSTAVTTVVTATASAR